MNNNKRVGLIRLSDLQDDTPVFDLRILGTYRSKGIGKQAQIGSPIIYSQHGPTNVELKVTRDKIIWH